MDNVTPITPDTKIVDDIVPGTNMKIIDTAWFTPGAGMHKVVAVLCEDQTMKYIQAYIGSGCGEPSDIENRVAMYGTKLVRGAAEAMFGYEMPDYKGSKR